MVSRFGQNRLFKGERDIFKTIVFPMVATLRRVEMRLFYGLYKQLIHFERTYASRPFLHYISDTLAKFLVVQEGWECLWPLQSKCQPLCRVEPQGSRLPNLEQLPALRPVLAPRSNGFERLYKTRSHLCRKGLFRFTRHGARLEGEAIECKLRISCDVRHLRSVRLFCLCNLLKRFLVKVLVISIVAVARRFPVQRQKDLFSMSVKFSLICVKPGFSHTVSFTDMRFPWKWIWG